MSDRVNFKNLAILKVAHSEYKCDHGAIDCGCACAAICLNHVTVDSNGKVSECIQVNAIAEAAANESLDFHSATTLFASGGFTVTARVGGSWKHAILCG